MKFDEIILKVQKGDVVSSKKGFLMISPLTNNAYLVNKQEYLGDGRWKVIGDKIQVEVNEK